MKAAILKFILERLGFAGTTGLGVWVMLGALGVAFLGGGWSGWKACTVVHEAKLLSQVQHAEKERQKLQSALAATDKKLVEALNHAQTKYRTIIKRIPAAVDPDTCQLSDDGMQQILDQVRSANSRRGYDAEVRPTP